MSFNSSAGKKLLFQYIAGESENRRNCWEENLETFSKINTHFPFDLAIPL